MKLIDILEDLSWLDLLTLNIALEIGVSEDFEPKPFKKFDLLDELAKNSDFAIDKYKNFRFFYTLIECEVFKKSKKQNDEEYRFTKEALRVISMFFNKCNIAEINSLRKEVSRYADVAANAETDLRIMSVDRNKFLGRLRTILDTSKSNIAPVDYDHIMNIFKAYEGGSPQ